METSVRVLKLSYSFPILARFSGMFAIDKRPIKKLKRCPQVSFFDSKRLLKLLTFRQNLFRLNLQLRDKKELGQLVVHLTFDQKIMGSYLFLLYCSHQ